MLYVNQNYLRIEPSINIDHMNIIMIYLIQYQSVCSTYRSITFCI